MTVDGAVRVGADSPVSEAEAGKLFGALDAFPALVLAVSGGPDSTALMWLAARWRAGLARPPKLIAVTVDHGLRPESAREALAVNRLAKKLKVAHRTLRWTAKKPKTGIQEAARNARYALLAGAAHKIGARHILTAHTLDDQAETVLFRMARGSGVSGLAGMRRSSPLPAGGERECMLMRPLLGVPKSRLIATLVAANIPFADDPSNRDPRFTRPRLRQLMPLLAAEGLDARRLAAFAGRMARADQAIEQAADEAAARLASGSASSVAFGRGYADLPAEVALRVLRRAIERLGDEGPIELGKLEALYEALGEARGRFRRTLAGAMITLSGAGLTVEGAPARRKAAKTRTSRAKAPFTKPR